MKDAPQSRPSARVSDLAVLYAVVPGFYAAVERLSDPSLRGVPVIVGGDRAKRGKVQSASREAVRAGVVEGMLMEDALELCPDARAVKTDMAHYREVAGALRVCLRSVAGALESAGIAGAYVDASGRRVAPEELGRRMIEAVQGEIGLALHVGIAPSKLVARLVAEELEGEGLRTLRPGDVADFLRPMSPARLPRVGPKALAVLTGLGVRCVGDLWTIAPEVLEQALPGRGRAILTAARGGTPAPVRATGHPASLSRESRIDPAEGVGLAACLRRVAQHLGRALQREGLAAARIALRVRHTDRAAVTRSSTPGVKLLGVADLHAEAERLLARVEDEAGVDPGAIRSLALTVAGLTPAGRDDRQLELFPASD